MAVDGPLRFHISRLTYNMAQSQWLLHNREQHFVETPIRSILIIRLSAIGDIVMASPLIGILRQHYPGIAIHARGRERTPRAGLVRKRLRTGENDLCKLSQY